jgi:hypothetical protein
VPQLPARSQSLAHPLRCRSGKTAFQRAIDRNKTDVVAYLHSIGALQ